MNTDFIRFMSSPRSHVKLPAYEATSTHSLLLMTGLPLNNLPMEPIYYLPR